MFKRFNLCLMAEKSPVLTEGQRLFDEFMAVNDLTLAAVSEVLGVSEPTVMNWRRGLSRPLSEFHRAKIEAYMGIPQNAWRTPEECEEIQAVRPFAAQSVA